MVYPTLPKQIQQKTIRENYVDPLDWHLRGPKNTAVLRIFLDVFFFEENMSKFENGQHVPYQGRMLKGIATYAYQHEGGGKPF